MNTYVARRFDHAGFVYVGQTRMGFSLPSAIERTEPSPEEPLVIWRAIGWPEPTKLEVAACIAALNREFPNRVIKLG